MRLKILCGMMSRLRFLDALDKYEKGFGNGNGWPSPRTFLLNIMALFGTGLESTLTPPLYALLGNGVLNSKKGYDNK
jgi:hypothetical protein